MNNTNDENLKMSSSCCNGDKDLPCDAATNGSSDTDFSLDLNNKSCEELIDLVRNAYQRIAELEAIKAHGESKHTRLLADFANYKSRVNREVQLAVTLSEKKILLEFLPVFDNFERCLALTYTSVEDLNGGVALIYKQLLEALRKVGVGGVEINIGDYFDAQHSEALTIVDRPDLPDGTVAMVFERGFMFRDQLLRPAKVIVNQKQAAE